VLPSAPVVLGTAAPQPFPRSAPVAFHTVSRSNLEAPLLLDRLPSPMLSHAVTPTPTGGRFTPTPSVTPPRTRPATPVGTVLPGPALAVRRWTPPAPVHLIHQSAGIVETAVRRGVCEPGIVHVKRASSARRARSADQPSCRRQYASELGGLTTVCQAPLRMVPREMPGAPGAQSRSRSGGPALGTIRRVQSQPASARGPPLVTVLEQSDRPAEASGTAEASPEKAAGHKSEGALNQHQPASHPAHESARSGSSFFNAEAVFGVSSGNSTPAHSTSWPSAVLTVDTSAAPKPQGTVTPRALAGGVSWDAVMETPSTAGELLEPPPSCVLLTEGGSFSVSSGPNSALNSARSGAIDMALGQHRGQMANFAQFGSIPSMPMSIGGEQVSLPTPISTPMMTSPGAFDLATVTKFAKERMAVALETAKPPAAPLTLSFTPPPIDEGIVAACVADKDTGKGNAAISDGVARGLEKETAFPASSSSSSRFESTAPLNGDLAAGVAIVEFNPSVAATDLRSAADATSSRGAALATPPGGRFSSDRLEVSLPVVHQRSTAAAFHRGAQHLEKNTSSAAMSRDASLSTLQAAKTQAGSTESESQVMDESFSPLQVARRQVGSSTSLDPDPQALNEAYMRLVKQPDKAAQPLAKRQTSPRRPKSPAKPSSTSAFGRSSSRPTPSKPGASAKASQVPRNTARRAPSRGRAGQQSSSH